MSKQDRQGARTVADLSRRYNVKNSFAKVMGVASDSLKTATEAKERAAWSAATAFEAMQGLEDKVSKNDDAQVVTMLNRAGDVVRFVAGRLVIESGNFTIAEDGSIVATAGKIGDWNIGKPAELAGYYNGSVLYSNAYLSESGEEVTVYLTPEKLYVEKRAGLEVSMDYVSWADIVRVVANAK